MHNIQITCPLMSVSTILLIPGGGEILSQEGTTQGDPLAMPWYSINTFVLIESLRLSLSDVKQGWSADDPAVNGKVESLYNWYKHLNLEGKKFGFLFNGSKSWLIVKSQALADEAQRVFEDHNR
jgi:hypothetical protein